MPYRHIPVMVSEVVDYLNCQPGKTYLDGTIGGTGHTSAILERIYPGGCLVGIDQDLMQSKTPKPCCSIPKPQHTSSMEIILNSLNFWSS